MAAFSAFHPQMSLECQGAPLPLVDDAVRRGAREFCKASHALTVEVSVSTSASVSDYDPIAASAQLTSLQVELVAVNFVRRNSADFLKAESAEYVTSQATSSGPPTMFAVVGTNVIDGTRKEIRFHPTPTSLENLFCDLAVMPLNSATALPDILADEYFEGVVAYAKYWLLSQVGRPWSNPEKAAMSFRQFDAKVADAIARKSQGYANIVRHVRMVPFA